jgi:hypothetical protein
VAQVKVFDVNNLSMKFSRHLDEEIVDFQVILHRHRHAALTLSNHHTTVLTLGMLFGNVAFSSS